MKYLLLCLVLLSCAAGEADRQICYTRADLNADHEIGKRCIDRGFKWSNCPEHDAIMLELQAEQKRCP